MAKVANNTRSKKHKVTLTIAACCIGLVLCLLISARAGQNGSKDKTNTITHSTSTPDESKSNAISYDWKGSAKDPKRISINKIDVDSLIQRTGVDQNKEITVPNNVHLAGWFVNSVQPGQQGLSIIAGHVTGKQSDGVFRNLNKLKKGDTFTVVRGDNTSLDYTVLTVKTVKADVASENVFSQDPTVRSQLNLVTCGGKFNSGLNQYEDRVIVSAQLQPLSMQSM